jgi:hypothetical protein
MGERPVTRCAKCNRPMKAPSASGMGPVCERAMLGMKARRVTRENRRSADARQLPLSLEAQA